MIEVEKKFQLTQSQLDLLLEDAQKLSEKEFTDVYFDYANWRLTTHDTWLRARDSMFELKVPLSKLGEDRKADQYHEITDADKIAQKLGLPASGSLNASLAKLGIAPFATIKTHRKKYRSGKFAIDVDEADFGYNVVEIELMAPNEESIDRITQEILDFAQTKGLETKKLNGKVCEYIERNNPAHYGALVKAGVFGDYDWKPKNKKN